MLGSTPSGFSEAPLGRVWPSLPHLVSSCLEFCWQLHRAFSDCPLGRVWPSLPHLVSNSLGVCWQLLWDPNSTELNNNSTPTRSPTGSLNRMFNRHQAEITVMQFRGYSLSVHHCLWHNGTFTLSHIISLNLPTRSLSITGHWNVSLPSGVSPWNRIFGPGRRSKYNMSLRVSLYFNLSQFNLPLHNSFSIAYFHYFSFSPSFPLPLSLLSLSLYIYIYMYIYISVSIFLSFHYFLLNPKHFQIVVLPNSIIVFRLDRKKSKKAF